MENRTNSTKTQQTYTIFISTISEFLKHQINDEFTEKNLLESGVTSLQMMRISNALRRNGYKISFGQMISDPYIKHWWHKVTIEEKKKSSVDHMTSYGRKEFPLTEVQYAYWIGRKEGQVLGGNACHAYFEFDPERINMNRLQKAWKVLQEQHPMLRAKFNANGMQEIMEQPYSKNRKCGRKFTCNP